MYSKRVILLSKNKRRNFWIRLFTGRKKRLCHTVQVQETLSCRTANTAMERLADKIFLIEIVCFFFLLIVFRGLSTLSSLMDLSFCPVGVPLEKRKRKIQNDWQKVKSMRVLQEPSEYSQNKNVNARFRFFLTWLSKNPPKTTCTYKHCYHCIIMYIQCLLSRKSSAYFS